MTAAVPLVAQLTPRGRGAVAVIAYRGDVAPIDAAGLFRAANGKPLSKQSIDRIAFGRWGDEPAEEVVVCRVASDRLEVHCHGGEAAALRITGQFESLGARRLSWREYLEQTEGALAADIAEALANAATPQTAAFIARQSTGPLRNAIEQLTELDVEHDGNDVRKRLDELLQHAEFGSHLTRPWHVVLWGPPNVGKSSLINALVGYERSIVYDRPGTTRDVVTAETAYEGWPLRFSDTAGLRDSAGDLEAAGIERARAALAAADLRLLVLDRSQPPEPGWEQNVAPAAADLVVWNKADLPDRRGPATEQSAACVVSAMTGGGVRDLLGQVVRRLVPEVPAEAEPVLVSPRQIELVRTAAGAMARHDIAAARTAILSLTGMNRLSRP